MGTKFEIPIASETGAFKKGIETGVIAPLEDAEKALDELGNSSGPEQLERDLVDAQEQSEKLRRETKETADAIDKEYRSAYRSMKESSRDATMHASEDVKSFKDEARQNLSEFASSFNGDIQDMAAGVQGLTGGLAAALTPGIGIPVALLGAAAATFLQTWITATEDAKARGEGMFQDFAESGRAFLSEDFIDKAVADILNDDGKRDKAKADAKALGLTVEQILRAQAGDEAALNAVLARGNDLRDAELEKIEQSNDTLDNKSARIDGINTKYGQLLAAYTDVNGEIQKSVDNISLYRSTVDEAYTVEQQRLEGIARHLAGIPDKKVVELDLDTSDFDRRVSEYQKKKITVRADIIARYGKPVPG